MVAERVTAKVDIVIVGAGAAGSLYAAKLQEAGKQVIVLEAGPAWNLGDLTSSQIWARRLKWGGAPVLQEGEHPFSHNLNMGWGLGGAALHHYGTWPRFSEETFQINTLYGKGIDWPITYEDLRPYYDAIQVEVGIAGDADQEPWRGPGKPYPMPPLKAFRHGEILKKGFQEIGLEPSPLPAAITTTEYNGRPACIYDGWCDAGCPIYSLANPHVVHLPAAEQAGAIFKTSCTVTRILTDDQNRATGVDYVDEAGNTQTQMADVVVLAASGVQNPRLLLNSANDKNPDGLGNTSGLLGAYFMLDALALTYGLFEEDDVENYMGVNAGQFYFRDSFQSDRRPHVTGSYQWQIGSAVKPNDIFGLALTRPNLIGDDLHMFIQKAAKQLAYMAGFASELPQAENRVRLADQKDAFGMPLAKVTHNYTRDTLALREHLLDEGQRALKAAGAYEAWTGPIAPGHINGGTIMGRDPDASVTDSYGRVHQIPNLIVTGSGLFPYSGGVSPTYTIYAVSLRSIEHMIDHWSDYTR